MGESRRRVTGAAQELARVLGVATVGGRIQVSWDARSATTPYGQLAFFIEFLTLTGLYPPWEAGCPLSYEGSNGSEVKDILGTLFLSVPAGHRRYARARMEAITSRPFLLSAVARSTRHGGQEHLRITYLHGKGDQARTLLTDVNRLLQQWKRTAEQLTSTSVWHLACEYLTAAVTGANGLAPLQTALLPAPETG
ncbi:MAG: hypothetical protein HY423_07350 [Candidatus Lambdaproteobacteria bacterium]|nr:hypothetical protein [Candidatus Lambdaproteobacteria bacterium]